MDMTAVIKELTAERDRIDGVIKLLSATGSAPTEKRRGRPPGTAKAPATPVPVAAPKKRKMSAAGRKRIAAAQKKRWAALKNKTPA